MDYNFLLNQIKNLDSSITQYESNHASQDFVAFKELLAATKALITEDSGKTRTVGTYQSGDFAKLKSVKRFAIAYKQATQQMESRVERVKAAQERDKVRFEALARSDKGWKDMAVGALTIIVGVTAIVVTLGSATPLVVAGGIVGLGSTAYGVSNMYEADQDIKLGNAGDIQTKAGNPIRDTLFMGNDKLYHDVGNVFTTASAIMIPIGQTGSVVKGLTQFAIGEASAYTAGQVAYHGTKLVGGSEEDAQTANFIGNIVGGFVASSAASKFSLNKVKNNLSEPNFANYREFSTRKFGDFKTNFQDVETKITVETRNAAGEIQRIQLKAVGIDETGKIRIQDYTTAKDGLSIKRQDSLDNLSKYGGTVVGEGKGRFTGGTKIEPGTRIEIISQKTSDISIEHVSPEIKKATFAKFRELASKEIDWNTPEKQASFEDTFDMYVERAVREGAAPNKEALYKMYQTRQYDYPKAYKDAIKQPYLKGGASSVVSGDNVKNFAFNNGKTVGRMDGGVGRGNFTTSIVEDSTLLYDKSGNLKSGSEIATVKGVRNDTYDSGMFQYEYSPELVKNMDKEGLIQFPNGDTPGSSSLNIPGAKTWAGSDIKMSESELLMPTIDMQGHSYDEFLYAIKKQGYYEIKNPTVVVPGENTTIDIEGIFRINQWSK